MSEQSPQNMLKPSITAQDRELIRNSFKDRQDLLKVIRKVFLPEYEIDREIGMEQVDLWMTIDIANLTPEQAYIKLIARNQLISHIEWALLRLYSISQEKELTEAEEIAKHKKDSMK